MSEFDDPVPPAILLDLDEVFRVLEALEGSLVVILDHGLAPGLLDELRTVIAMLHHRLGFDQGGWNV
ncbi:MAG TPA: hypothetical protein VNQ73_07495 [Ilumatobacter sp.]|nr:hypothetical protein [Ilumatobacter sp.]